MDRRIREERGRYAARGGFAHERQVRDEFANWQQSFKAKEWLELMGFDLNTISCIDAERPTEHGKTDVRLRVMLKDAGLMSMRMNLAFQKPPDMP